MYTYIYTVNNSTVYYVYISRLTILSMRLAGNIGYATTLHSNPNPNPNPNSSATPRPLGKTHTEEIRTKKKSEIHKGNSYCKGKGNVPPPGAPSMIKFMARRTAICKLRN